MLERINLIIKTKSLSASQFADKVGVQRSSVSHVLSGRNKPSLEFIQKVLKKFPDIRSEWLLFGQGSMSNTSDLFSNVDENEPKAGQIEKVDSNDSNTEKGSSTEVNTPITTSDIIKPGKVSSKAIDKIVLFFNDKSFVEYRPE